jgi:hypothetical protein
MLAVGGQNAMNGSNGHSPRIEKRQAPRMDIEPLEVTAFTSLDHRTLLSRSGLIIEASTTGFCLHVDRKDLVPKVFRDSLSLKALEGDRVMLMIPQMNLEISGTVKRTTRLGKNTFEIGIDYSQDAPEYWRECLLDLLPRPGEFGIEDGESDD